VQRTVVQIMLAFQWERLITQSLPKELDGILPSIEEIEAEFSGGSDE